MTDVVANTLELIYGLAHCTVTVVMNVERHVFKFLALTAVSYLSAIFQELSKIPISSVMQNVEESGEVGTSLVLTTLTGKKMLR